MVGFSILYDIYDFLVYGKDLILPQKDSTIQKSSINVSADAIKEQVMHIDFLYTSFLEIKPHQNFFTTRLTPF